MDTTPEYIEQSRQATEIQAEWKPTLGDFIQGPTQRPPHPILTIELIDSIIEDKNTFDKPWCVWLPRQDQLQDMINLKCAASPLQELNRRFYRWSTNTDEDGVGNYSIPAIYIFSSMEQLWLAFIMVEKYGMRWTGSGWVRE